MPNNIYDLRNIRVIVGSKPSIPKIKFTKEDSETCQISFELFRTPTEPLEGISYATVTLRYPSGRDSTFGASDVSVVDNLVTFTLPVSALYELGVVEGELQVYGDTFKRLTACDFKYTVQDVIIMGEYILNDDRYPILTDLIQIVLNSGVAEDERVQNEIERQANEVQRQENEIQREIDHQNNISEFIAKIKEVDEWIYYGNMTLDSKILEVDENLKQLVEKISSDLEILIASYEARVKALETRVDNKITQVDTQVGIMWEDYEDLKGTITDENVIGNLTARIQELEKNKSDVGHKHDELYASLSEFNAMKDQIAENKPIIISDDVPIGTIVWYSSWNTPSNDYWKVCNGATLNKADFPELWALIGTNGWFGNADGGDTFLLPNLVGERRFIRSVGDDYQPGEMQWGAIESHSHKIGLAREATGNDGNYQTIIGSQGNVGRQPGGHCPENGDPAYTVNASGGTETRPVNMALVPYIKCKQRAKDMITVAQEWTQFKDNGGTINGYINAMGVTSIEGNALNLSSKNGSVYIRPSSGTDKYGIVLGGQSGTLAPMVDNELLLGNSSRFFKEIYGFKVFTSEINNTIGTLRLGSQTSGILLKSGTTNFSPEVTEQTSLGTPSLKFSDVWVGPYNRSNDGYIKLTNGMIMQWGSVNIEFGGSVHSAQSPVTFPIAFPSACRFPCAEVNTVSVGSPSSCMCRCISVSASSMQVQMYSTEGSKTGTAIARWFAIGH